MADSFNFERAHEFPVGGFALETSWYLVYKLEPLHLCYKKAISYPQPPCIVKSIVPADSLLVYDVKEGWKSLCDFLECEVPTFDFPQENINAEILKTVMTTRCGQQVKWEVQRVVFAIGSILAVMIVAILAICKSVKWLWSDLCF